MAKVDHVVLSRPRKPVAARVPTDPGLALLQCPLCGGFLTPTELRQIECGLCHKVISAPDGIIDFVAGTLSTQLDNIDYDQFYSINESASLILFDIITKAAGSRWPAGLGDAVEIGCGTGVFSSVVLRRQPADRVILTDVSGKMLGMCRDRLERLDDLRSGSVTFATYSGTEDCFRPSAFDTCFGTSVLHHVVDVSRVLAQIHRILKPAGRAFFMEPNARFHAALTATLAGILAEWCKLETVPEPQISLMLNWMAEVHCNISNSGDLEILAQREDKHYFIGEAFEAMAEAAGFTMAIALACSPDPTGYGAIEAYLRQVGANDQTLDLLREAWSVVQDDHFGSLKPRDQSPSYLFWLEKVPGKQKVRPAAAGRRGGTRNQAKPAAHRPMRLWMTLALQRRENGLEVTAEGWCLAGAAVRAVRLTLRGARHRLPIWLPRPDVQAAVNADNTYPPLHAFCSGINGTIRLAEAATGDDPIEVGVDVLCVDGSVAPKGTYALKPDGESVLIQ